MFTDVYFSTSWQPLEERSTENGFVNINDPLHYITVQYVWSPQKMDELILRDRSTLTYYPVEEELTGFSSGATPTFVDVVAFVSRLLGNPTQIVEFPLCGHGAVGISASRLQTVAVLVIKALGTFEDMIVDQTTLSLFGQFNRMYPIPGQPNLLEGYKREYARHKEYLLAPGDEAGGWAAVGRRGAWNCPAIHPVR